MWCGHSSTLTSGRAQHHVMEVMEPGCMELVGGVSHSSNFRAQ